MAQFDVHLNPGRSKREVPFFVSVQSGEFASSGRLVVVPLLLASLERHPMTRVFEIEDRAVVANPLLIFSIEVEKLGDRVTTLSDDEGASDIMDALDRVISQAYG